ncbi:MAG: MBL fold metallo-hydrolase [Acidobacteriota bacterium]|nr:MBL fold metallo-hydrolase [Acidobacteriota bacterium]
MKIINALLFLSIFLCGCAIYGQNISTDPLEIKFKKLRDDIYVAYRPDTLKYWVEGNVIIIINDEDVVVVDASGAPRSAQTVIAEIRRLTKKPVRYLINTHGHGDHTIGNQEYLKAFPGIEIIAHEKTAEYIVGSGYNYVDEIAGSTESRKKTGEAEIARLKAENKPGNEKIIENLVQYYRRDIDIRQAEYKKVKRTAPTLNVTKSIRLYRGKRIIDILHFGAGDTPGDLVVYLPQEKIVCTGDMLTEPVPFGFSRFPLDWLQTLSQVSQLDFDTLIPGHGEIQTGKAYLQKMMNLLQSVQRQVKRGLDAGLDLEGVKKQTDLTTFERDFAGENPVYRYYFQEYFSKPNIERTFNQMKEKSPK